jgi:hypothetical protein
MLFWRIFASMDGALPCDSGALVFWSFASRIWPAQANVRLYLVLNSLGVVRSHEITLFTRKQNKAIVQGSLCYCANLDSLIPRLFWFGQLITNRSLLGHAGSLE